MTERFSVEEEAKKEIEELAEKYKATHMCDVLEKISELCLAIIAKLLEPQPIAKAYACVKTVQEFCVDTEKFLRQLRKNCSLMEEDIDNRRGKRKGKLSYIE